MNADDWIFVEDCYHAALERPVSERTAFLAQACGNNAELRREVESLLGHEGEADSLLETPAWRHVGAPSAIAAGSSIGVYRIVSKLGEGGMGEVFRATDTKLHREVALKVVAREYASDPNWRARFEREARVLASLNHPNIAAIYGLEESGGQYAIAMELVEGVSLSERMAKGRVPIPEALQIARQIAEALQYAHQAGVIHRDLKPANLKLRPDGVVKVLDFGLAKSVDSKESPVETATRTGVVMGTPAYMPPEQAAGKPVDCRADVWAFGVVLFEMVSGRPVYARQSTLETLAAVARDDPPWKDLPAETPAAVVRLLRRCLDRDPETRLRDLGEARIALDTKVSITEGRRGRRWTIAIASAALAALVLVVFLDRAWLAPKSVTIKLGTLSGFPAISPDGTAVLFGNLGVHRLDSPPTLSDKDLAHDILLPKHEQASSKPVWSPDSSQILFYNDQSGIWRMPVPNGPAISIGPTLGITRGCAWGPDGATLCAALGSRRGLFLTNTEGKERKPLDVPGLAGGDFFYPEFLPDGEDILFGWAADGDWNIGTYLARLTGGRIVRGPFLLRKDLTVGHYSPARGGMLLYVSGDTLFAERLDVGHGKLDGKPRKIVDSVSSDPTQSYASFSVSRNGVLCWREGHASLGRLTWFDRQGRVLGMTGPSCTPDMALISPDESRILFETPVDNAGYGIAETARMGFFPLPAVDAPIWLPGSTDILYRKREADGFRILRRAVAGGPEREIARFPFPVEPNDISPDGRSLLLVTSIEGEGRSLYTLRLNDGLKPAEPELFAKGAGQGKFAPSGHWIVYPARSGGRPHIYAQPFPVHGRPVQIDEQGGTSPVWRKDGKEILYLYRGTIYSVDVDIQGATIHVGAARPLFKVRTPGGMVGGSCPLGVTRDGQRILFAQGVEQPDPQLYYAMTAFDRNLK